MDIQETIQKAIVSRREMLKTMGAAGLTTMFSRLAGAQQAPQTPEGANFVFTRLIYDGGDWNTDTLTEGKLNGAEIHLMNRLNALSNHNLQAFEQEHSIRADSNDVFEHPFLYVTGHGDVDLNPQGRENVKRIIQNGGFLLADNCSGAKDVGFDRGFRTQLQLMFPENPLEQLPMSHPVFSSLHKIDRVQGGDKLLDPFLEGVDIDGRTAIIYTRNDLGCAWEGHHCLPGGEAQRTHAFKMGMNIVFYALSGI
ncbi:MAG: DUF4159 domain-containing protein [Candidatus Omnitrophica bacterium]|nr:DUF4159 domain-containing protein [Candidatus Omnitrophota bacterium]